MVVKNERKRYLLVEFSADPPKKRDLIRKLRDTIAVLGGQIALANSSVHVVDIISSFAIVRAAHSYRDLVEASLQLLNFRHNHLVVRTVSGSISKINSLLNTEYSK